MKEQELLSAWKEEESVRKKQTCRGIIGVSFWII